MSRFVKYSRQNLGPSRFVHAQVLDVFEGTKMTRGKDGCIDIWDGSTLIASLQLRAGETLRKIGGISDGEMLGQMGIKADFEER